MTQKNNKKMSNKQSKIFEKKKKKIIIAVPISLQLQYEFYLDVDNW